MATDSKSLTFIYQGRSMINVFREGQTIVASPVHRFEIGSIYVFLYHGELTIHRLIGKENHNLIFKGDFSLCTENVSAEAVLGFVQSSFKNYYLFLSRHNQFNRPRIIRILSRQTMKILSYFFKQPI